MQAGNTNILDQLLGGFNAPVSSATGAKSGVAGSTDGGPLFGSLLNLAFQPKQDGALELSLPSEELLPSSDQPSNAQDAAPAGPTVSNLSLLSLIGELAPDATEQLAPDTEPYLGELLTGDAEPVQPDSDFIKVVALDAADDLEAESFWREQLPKLTALSQQQLLALQKGQQNLPAGEYRVINQQLVDGLVELTLESAGESEPIKVSLPAEALEITGLIDEETTDLKLPNRLNRVELIGAETTRQRVDRLLSQMNLKAIRIDAPTVPVDKDVETPAPVTLIADQGGQTVELKVRQAVIPVMIDPPKSLKEDVRSTATIDANQIVADPEAEEVPRPLTMLEPSLKSNLTGQQVRFDVGEKIMVKSKTVVTESELPTLNNLSGQAKFSTAPELVEKLAPSVRMTLPEQIHKPFAASGQSLMIKIHPEHLGPARLNLSLHDHVLSARVTVDTPLAKAAVENSLHQLTDQLSRAGIDVDRIDVALADRNPQDNLFGGQPDWYASRKQSRYNDNDTDPADETVGSIPVIETYATRSLPAQGIDLLA